MSEDAPSLVQVLSMHQNSAEKMFSGAVMINPEYARESCGWLSPTAINDPQISRYWEMVKNGCEPSDAAIQCGIYLDVAHQMTQIVSSYDAPSFANAIAQDKFLATSSAILSRMAKAIAERSSEDLRKFAQSIIESSPTQDGKIATAVDIGLEFQATLDDVDKIIVPTGIIPLDKNMGGYERATLVIVGGRPGMGKTSFGLQSAVEAARKKQRVIYFSLEMSKRDLWARIACGRVRVDWRKVMAKTAGPEERKLVEDATADLMDELEDRFMVDDAPMTSSEDIFRRVAEIKPDLIVVDHLDLVDRKERGRINEVIRVGNVSRMGKVIAKQFDIPAVYLTQLNRKLEDRTDKRPQLSDLRASGEIEQDADIVMFLHRPDYHDHDKRGETVVSCEIWLEKVRNGNAGAKAETMLDLQEQHFYPVRYPDNPEPAPAQVPAKSYSKKKSTIPEDPPDWGNEDMPL
jgi:replicative DNA helicase